MKKITNLEERIQNNDVLKRGGICKTHGIQGVKLVTKLKDWVQKKNGLYEYVSKQQTTYRCSGSAVDVVQSSPTNVMNTSRELDRGL